MKYPKLYAVCINLLFFFSFFFFLSAQTITPTLVSSFGSSNATVTLCANDPISFEVENFPSNSTFRHYRIPQGGSAQALSISPNIAQFTTSTHEDGDRYFSEVFYSLGGPVVSIATDSIAINHQQAPMNLSISSNLSSAFYCSNSSIRFTASGADFYEFYINGILGQSSSTLDTFEPQNLRGSVDIIVRGYNLFGCSSLTSYTLVEIALSPGTIQGNQILNLDDIPQTITSQTEATLSGELFSQVTNGVYQWESSFDGIHWDEILFANEVE